MKKAVSKYNRINRFIFLILVITVMLITWIVYTSHSVALERQQVYHTLQSPVSEQVIISGVIPQRGFEVPHTLPVYCSSKVFNVGMLRVVCMSEFTAAFSGDLTGEPITVWQQLGNSFANGWYVQESVTKSDAIWKHEAERTDLPNYSALSVPVKRDRESIGILSGGPNSGLLFTAVIALLAACFVLFIIISSKRHKARLEEANRLLALSEERFHIALENTTVSVWDYDFNSHCILQNDHSIRQHGFNHIIPDVPESLIRDRYVHPDNATAFRKMYDTLLHGAKTVEGVFRVRTADRKGWWYEHIRYTALFDENGKPYRAIGMSEDVTEKQMAKLAYKREQELQSVLAPDVVASLLFDVTTDRLIRHHFRDPIQSKVLPNLTISSFTRYAADMVVGNPDAANKLSSFNTETALRWFNSGRWEHILEYRRRMDDGSIRWVHDEMHLITDPDSGHLMLFLCLRDIDDEKRERAALTLAAKVDSMTGILNHGAILLAIDRDIASLSPEALHALFIVDIDNFKFINDTFGHQAGDDVIKNISAILRDNFRDSDHIGRIGGDEFAVLMRNISSAEDAVHKAAEVVQALQYTYTNDDPALKISCSVGVALCDASICTTDALYAKADNALYQAKAAGKRCYYVNH
ncbi:MAG: diguanylate cyclase [Clostridiaceae bacterium]|nr:diguanylate cyclase [Clostridiaceae bacterium]